MATQTAVRGLDSLGENFTIEEYMALISERRLHWFSLNVELPLILVYGLLTIFGIASNGIVCYIVLRVKQLRTTRNLLIVNLAISDIIMSAFCVPFTLLKLILKNWPLGDTLCRLVPCVQAVSVFASTMTIAAIALDRYETLMRPVALQPDTHYRATITGIVLIWVVAALVGLPLMLYSHVQFKQLMPYIGFDICLEEWPSSLTRSLYAVVIMLLQFVAPIAILLVLHWRLCSHLKYCLQIQPSTSEEFLRMIKHAKRHRKNTHLLIAIAVMFALCWFPLTLLNFLADFNISMFMYHNFLLAFALAHIIAMVSACVNPILYGWFNAKFRMEFTKIVCFWRKRNTLHIDNENATHNALEVVQRRRSSLPLKDEREVFYRESICYKSIQTEVQPVFKHSCSSSPLKTPSSGHSVLW